MTVEEAKQQLAQNPIKVSPEVREVLVRDMGEAGFRKFRIERSREHAESIRIDAGIKPWSSK